MQETIKIKTSNRAQAVSGITLGLGLLAGASCFLHPFVSDNSYASNTTISVSHSSEDWHISAPTSTAADAGGINFDITSSPDGVHVAKKDVVTGGNTNVPDYQIYVSVNTADGKMLATSGDSYIAATSGTVTDATDSSSITGAAALSNNSWGFALGSFNSGINYDDLVSSSTHTDWSSSKWAKLPYVSSDNVNNESTIESNAIKIYDSTTSSTNSTNVYYAVHANNDLSAGEYETKVTYTTIGLIPTTTEYMQDFTAEKCSALSQWKADGTEGDTITLSDSRDENEYQIRQLADGHCWMVSNLAITDKAISTADSDSAGDFTVPASAGGSGEEAWVNSFDTAYMHIGNATDDGSNGWVSGMGPYYNWNAATAGQGAESPSSGDVDYSICPKGWKLPSGTVDDYSWYNLATKHGFTSNNNDTSIFQIVANTNPNHGGGQYNGNLYSTGSNGYTAYGLWWTREVENNNYVRNLQIPAPLFTVIGGSDKKYGHPIRCVFVGS